MASEIDIIDWEVIELLQQSGRIFHLRERLRRNHRLSEQVHIGMTNSRIQCRRRKFRAEGVIFSIEKLGSNLGPMDDINNLRDELVEELEKAIDAVFASRGMAFSCDGTGIAEELVDIAFDFERM